jgi:arylsulfatase A-like enzyme
MGEKRLARAAVVLGGLALVAGLVLSVDVRLPSRPERSIDALAELRNRDDLNVIFILVDTLRADHLGVYGYERDTSPFLDQMTASGVRFADVQCQSTWTKSSMASLWLGAYPARTGVLRLSHAIPEAATLPAEILSDAGFRTVGIWRNGWVANNFGFAQGFDVYYRPQPGRAALEVRRGNPSAHPLLGTDYDATEAALEFLRSYRNDRVFLYVHYMDVHQYLYDEQSGRFGTDYKDAYDNAIHWTDRNLGRLITAADELGLLERSIVVLASDHGEAFYEHGGEGHARNLYGEVTQTPLLLWLPFRLKQELVVESRVENVDIWPTLLDLLGLPALPGAQGRSLVPLMQAAARGEEPAPERPSYAQLDRTWGQVDARPLPLVSVIRGDLRLFHRPNAPRAAELYDLSSDPGERNNLARVRPEEVAQLRRQAETHLATPPPEWGAPEDRELDEMRLQQLRALGYVVGGADRR